MKKFLCLTLVCLFLLSACAKSDISQYKNDVSVEDISTKIYENIKSETLIKADADWIAFNIPIDTSSCEDSTVYISADGGSDHFGIFKATSEENAEKLYTQAQDYIDNMEKNWMSEYQPDELPKVQNAVTKKCGVYVAFIILEDEARENAEKIFTDMLTK